GHRSPGLLTALAQPSDEMRRLVASLSRAVNPPSSGVVVTSLSVPRERRTNPMKRRLSFGFAVAACALGILAATAATAVAKKPKNVGPGGQVRFGVEPYDTAANMQPAYTALTAAMSKNLHCTVKLFITQDYVSEIEAMRNKKLDVGEFGPLGYIFAKKLAKA